MSTPPINPALLHPAGGVAPVAPVAPTRRADGASRASGDAFSQALREATAPQQAAGSAPVTFSGHALQRLERRGIVVDETVQRRLGDGVDRAQQKGSRAAVVLIDENAFVVGVPSRTVITAVGRDHMREHVFTNIDAAVIA